MKSIWLVCISLAFFANHFANHMPRAWALEQGPLEQTQLEQGQVDVFIFEDGLPKANINLMIDGRKFSSGEDGGIFLTMPQGSYRLQIGPEIRTFRIESDQLTRIMINQGKTETSIDIAEPPASQAASENNSSNEALQKISGIVKSGETSQPLSEVKVFVGGRADRATSDAAGKFSLMLPKGKYTLSFIHRSHSAKNQEIALEGGKNSEEIEIELNALAKVSLQEIVVTAPQLAGSLASLIQERKASANVSDVLGSEQISKSGDSDAGSALRRVTGLSLIDGRYIYVRGLGERYSSSLLNNSVLPSPHPAKRVVPLDLFPASILEGVTIQKTYTADMPGEFGGGTVLLRTKSLPDKAFFSIGLSTNFIQGATGKEGLSYKGGSKDWTGYDDGTRALPGSIERAGKDRNINDDNFSDEELRAMGTSLKPMYSTKKITLPWGRGLNVSLGSKATPIAKVELGASLALIYGQDFSNEERRKSTYSVASAETGNMLLDTQADIETTRVETKVGAMLTTGARIAKDTDLKNTTLLVRKTEDYTQFEDQLNASSDDIHYLRTTLSWQERELFTNQTSIEHTFKQFHDLHLGLRHTISEAGLYAPDRRRYVYKFSDGESSLSEVPRRIFGELSDTSRDDTIDLKLPLKFTKEEKLTLMIGGQYISRERSSDTRRFTFGNAVPAEQTTLPLEQIFSEENIANGTYVLEEQTNNTDNYNAEQAIKAYYAAFDLELWGWFRFYSGLRYEKSEQRVETFELNNANNQPIVADLTTIHTLPVFSLTFSLQNDMQIRLSRSKTLSRPDLKELSQAQYYDDDNGITISGYENLRATAIISHDLRWEYYLKNKQYISLGAFQKDFDKPVELFVENSADDIYSFRNADSAYIRGIEGDLRFNLAQGDSWLKDLFISGNSTFIWSEVDLGAQAIESTVTSTKRALQGQAAYIHNYTFGYDNPKTASVISLLYHHIGERIRGVGTNTAPDIIEEPYDQFDLVTMKTLDKGFKLGFKARNLFPKDSIFMQGPKESQRRKTYRSFSFDTAYTF